MTIAATWSSHQKPSPMPTTPTMPAAAVCQSALFMSASAYSTLSCRSLAGFSFARPSRTGGTSV